MSVPAVENIDEPQAETIRATGAGWWQVINYGIQPQVMPRLIGLSMYRLDIGQGAVRDHLIRARSASRRCHPAVTQDG